MYGSSVSIKNVFEGIFGYEDTVIPNVERAILSRHSINLLGLRGQAKTKLARMMVQLLDENIPIIEGSEVNDDPFSPISKYGKRINKSIKKIGTSAVRSSIMRKLAF